MDFSCRTRALSSLVKDIAKDKFNFNHPLQRKEQQWNRLQKSELIDSILRSYPIDPIRGIKNFDILDVIDGKQRATCIRDYISDGFALSKSLEPVTIEDIEYDIANKKFSKLDEVLQDKIKSYEIQVYSFTDCTEKDVREMFRRQNNGKALSNTQKRTAIESSELSEIVFSLISHPFFAKTISKAQAKKDDDKDIVREILMLTEDYTSFRSEDINKFIEYYNDNIDMDKIEIVKTALDKLDESFEEIKIKKTSLPIACYGMYEIIKDGKDVEQYLYWLNEFLTNYETNEDYLQYCGRGTSNADMVMGRLNYFKDAIAKM